MSVGHTAQRSEWAELGFISTAQDCGYKKWIEREQQAEWVTESKREVPDTFCTYPLSENAPNNLLGLLYAGWLYILGYYEVLNLNKQCDILSDEFYSQFNWHRIHTFEMVTLIQMFACLGELRMAHEEKGGFGALPSPAISHTLLDFKRLLNVSTHFFGWRPSLGSHAWSQ